MHVFNIAEIFGKEGSDDDDLAVCWNNRTVENIDGCCTTNVDKTIANTINKKRQIR